MTDPRATAVTSDGQSGSTIGIRFDRSVGEACAALLCGAGYPSQNAPEIRASCRESIPSELARRIQMLEIDASTLDERAAVSGEITGIAIRLAQSILRQAKEVPDILAVGSHGCGVWDCGDAERFRSELCNPAVLAEATGITIIDEFPARDLAQGGLGGPVEAHGLWLLLADRSPIPGRCWRAAIDIGPSVTQCTLISPFDTKGRKEGPVASNVCVGQRLFSTLSSQIGPPGAALDYAKLAAQGKVITELLAHWTALGSSDPEWRPEGISALPLLYALKNSKYGSAPLTDLLATATSYVAGKIATFVRHHIDHSRPVGEVLMMGEGTRNGLLVQQLRERLPAVRLRLLNESEHQCSIQAASIAALALLHVWQIPLTPSRGGVPRVLGRLTPGSPSNWQRVLNVMTANSPWLLPLREAM